MVFNLLGKLGKAVGLEGEFGKGFVSGAAGRVSKTINEDIEKTKENASRLAQIRFERGVKEKDRYDEESKENELQIKALVASLDGNTDAVRYILQKNEYNVDSAKQEIDKLLVNKEYGMTVSDIVNNVIGLEQSTNRAVTVEELTDFVTKPISVPDITKFDDVASGVMRLPFFGGGEKATERAMAKSTAELKAYGVYPSIEEVEKNTPPALKGKINPIFSNRLSNPAQEVNRLTNLAIKFKSQGQEALAIEALAERDTINLGVVLAQQGLSGQPGGAFSATLKNNVTNGFLATAERFYDTHEWDGVRYIANAEAKDRAVQIENVIDNLVSILDLTANKDPLSFSQNYRILNRALRNNQQYEVFAYDENGNLIDTSKTSLTAFPGVIRKIDVEIKQPKNDDEKLPLINPEFYTPDNTGGGNLTTNNAVSNANLKSQIKNQVSQQQQPSANAAAIISNVRSIMSTNNPDLRAARAELSALRRKGFDDEADKLKAQYPAL